MFESRNIYVLIFAFISGASLINASQLAVKGASAQQHPKAEVADVKIASEATATSMLRLDVKQLAELKADPLKFNELTIQHDKIVTAVAINKQKTLIAIGDRIGNTYVRDLKTNKILTILFNDDPLSSVRCIKFHPTRNVVVVGYSHRLDKQETGVFQIGKYSVTFEKRKQFLVWFDLDTPQQVHLNGHSDWVSDVDFNFDGSMLGSIADDKTVVLWDTVFKEVMHTFKTHESYGKSISFNADGSLIASAAFDGKVNVHDVAKLCLLWSKKMNQNSNVKKCCNSVNCQFLNFKDASVALFHPTQPLTLAVVGTDNEVELIDARAQKKISGAAIGIKDKPRDNVRPYFKWISALAFNANGSKLSCMHECGSLTTWHLNKKENNITWANLNKACHIYGSMACANDTLYAGYGYTSDSMEKFKEERNIAPGFVFKWNTDINHG